jgi:hypothetical protein
MLLGRLQALLTRLYDAPVAHDVAEFLITDRVALTALTGISPSERDDEQVIVVQDGATVRLGVYLDPAVIERLAAHDPLDSLEDANLADFCTALEGVSHFHYLMWSIARGRDVSLLELELQAEVDKYAAAVALITRQRGGEFPHALHARLFDRIGFLPGLEAVARRRYEEASRHAARYCRSLEQRYLRPQRVRPEAWLGELRRFFRCGHQEKIRQLAV